MEEIIRIATEFRKAIDRAKKEGCFKNDFSFQEFPRGCCGDTSVLLAHHLLIKGVQTDYVCGNYYGNPEDGFQSHAWLKLTNGTIIDVTGDQFRYNAEFLNYNIPVYIGDIDEFHELFDVEERDVRKSVMLKRLGDFCYPRLKQLYDTIIEYID